MLQRHMTKTGTPTRPSSLRWDIALRSALAVIGGYIFSSLVAAAIARFLPGDRANAALTGTMTSFAVFPAIVMWAFGARRAWLAAAVLSAMSAVLGVLIAWSIAGGGQL